MLTDADMAAIALSLRVSLTAVALSVVPCVLLAAWLARSRSRLKALVETLVITPLVLPPVVTGMILLTAVSKLKLGIGFTWWAAVLASAVVSGPLLVRTVRATLMTMDPRLGHVAATLGASRLRVFLTVTLPLAWPAVVAGVTLAWARALGEFGATLIVAGNIPGKTQTIPLAMYTGWQTGNRPVWPLALVAVGLALMAVSVAEWLARRVPQVRRHATASNLQTL